MKYYLLFSVTLDTQIRVVVTLFSKRYLLNKDYFMFRTSFNNFRLNGIRKYNHLIGFEFLFKLITTTLKFPRFFKFRRFVEVYIEKYNILS